MIAFLFFFLALFPLQAEEIEPEEPDIVLPEVILKIEDLSVESVEAGLPEEEELLPVSLGRGIPLPEEEELIIKEPALPDLAAAETSPMPEGSALIAEVVLGAGIMNHIISTVSLYRVGEEPRFKLKFLHEMLDGRIDRDAGTGFDLREDRLEGGIKFHLSDLTVNAGIELEDNEQGLQGESLSFVSRLFRRGGADISLLYPLGERFSLGAGVESGFSSQLLTVPAGGTPKTNTEVLVAPNLFGELRLDGVRFEIGSRYAYAYRRWRGDPANLRHRLEVNGLIGIDFTDYLVLEGKGGWFWSNAQGSLFPFSLTLSGTPFPAFTFRAGGGYRVEELDYYDLLGGYALIGLPAGLLDNHGWFGSLDTGFSFIRSVSLQAGIFFASDEAMPDPQVNRDADGLFPFSRKKALRLSTTFGLKWDLLSFLTLKGGLTSEWLDRPGYTPIHSLLAEAEAGEASGLWGANLSFLLSFRREDIRFLDRYQSPVLDLSGYGRLSENVVLIGVVEDLLQPLIGEPRYTWHPYEDLGLRATLKVQITL